jgi:hypothetical protein
LAGEEKVEVKATPEKVQSEKKDRDWFDIVDLVGKWLIPISIFGFGTYLTIQQKRADADRQQFERDTDYIKMLASDQPKEQALGVSIIAVRSHRGDFAAYDILNAFIANSDKDDRTTQRAILILCTARGEEPFCTYQPPPSNDVAKLASDSTKHSNNSVGSAVDVYIQITSEDQRQDAERLAKTLQADGFNPLRIQLVAGSIATSNTYVRFFSASSAAAAGSVSDIMKKMGYQNPGVQDFSAYVAKPLSSVEVWIGKKQSVLTKAS